jgi:hypothetical protein
MRRIRRRSTLNVLYKLLGFGIRLVSLSWNIIEYSAVNGEIRTCVPWAGREKIMWNPNKKWQVPQQLQAERNTFASLNGTPSGTDGVVRLRPKVTGASGRSFINYSKGSGII